MQWIFFSLAAIEIFVLHFFKEEFGCIGCHTKKNYLYNNILHIDTKHAIVKNTRRYI